MIGCAAIYWKLSKAIKFFKFVLKWIRFHPLEDRLIPDLYRFLNKLISQIIKTKNLFNILTNWKLFKYILKSNSK